MKRSRSVIALVVVALGLSASPAYADKVVNTLGDAGTGGCTAAECTLREAVIDATGPTDPVIVPAGTYNLTQGPLQLVGRTIAGAGARTTIIDAGGTAKVFDVTDGSNSASGVTLRNGGGSTPVNQGPNTGGAVLLRQGSFAPASLTLTNVTVSGSTSTSAGAGVASLGGSLTILDSTIVGNTVTSGGAPPGGGVFVAGGATTIRDSTVSGNATVDVDGSEAQGGGVFIENGTLNTDGVTIANNRSNDGGGLYVNTTGTPTISLSRTLIAGNTPNACGGGPFTGANDLADDATCTFAGSPQNPLLVALANNGGQTDTHAVAAGSPAINAGGSCSTTTDQRGVAREGACDIGAYEYVTPAPPPPPPPLADPVVGKSFNVFPVSGTVKIKRRGSKHFHLLVAGEHIPIGSTIDTRKGRIKVVAAANKSGKTATADFFDGLFKITQNKKSTPITVLTLVEKLTGCKATGKATAAAAKKKKRRLWGDGKGRFQTKGKHSAATVVGTRWLVEDRCDSTLTRVKRGKVKVRDFAKKKTVIVRKGHRYIARAQ
jgi:hypothetical protein